MNPNHFAAAFFQGSTRGHDGVELRFASRAVGELVLPTGAIVACDPGILDDYAPLARRVAPGRYPVILSIAQIDRDQRVAYAMIRFAEGEVSRWELAAPEPTDPRARPADAGGYGVDTAMGCFMDEVVVKRAREEYDRYDRKEESLWKDFTEQLGHTYVDTWSWANATFDPETGANLVAFSSGYGDGFYSSYFGLDSAGNPVCLVTDFKVIDTWTTPKKPNKPWWKFWESGSGTR